MLELQLQGFLTSNKLLIEFSINLVWSFTMAFTAVIEKIKGNGQKKHGQCLVYIFVKMKRTKKGKVTILLI